MLSGPITWTGGGETWELIAMYRKRSQRSFYMQCSEESSKPGQHVKAIAMLLTTTRTAMLRMSCRSQAHTAPATPVADFIIGCLLMPCRQAVTDEHASKAHSGHAHSTLLSFRQSGCVCLFGKGGPLTLELPAAEAKLTHEQLRLGPLEVQVTRCCVAVLAC